MPMQSRSEEVLSTLERERGDKRLEIVGLDLGGNPAFGPTGKRVALGILRTDMDEPSGISVWIPVGERFPLRETELDRLIEMLHKAKAEWFGAVSHD